MSMWKVFCNELFKKISVFTDFKMVLPLNN